MDISILNEKFKLATVIALKIFLKNEKKKVSKKPFTLNCECEICQQFLLFLKDDSQKTLTYKNDNHLNSKILESIGIRNLINYSSGTIITKVSQKIIDDELKNQTESYNFNEKLNNLPEKFINLIEKSYPNKFIKFICKNIKEGEKLFLVAKILKELNKIENSLIIAEQVSKSKEINKTDLLIEFCEFANSNNRKDVAFNISKEIAFKNPRESFIFLEKYFNGIIYIN
jgi:hypothetical protein